MGLFSRKQPEPKEIYPYEHAELTDEEFLEALSQQTAYLRAKNDIALLMNPDLTFQQREKVRALVYKERSDP